MMLWTSYPRIGRVRLFVSVGSGGIVSCLLVCLRFDEPFFEVSVAATFVRFSVNRSIALSNGL